MLQGQNVFAVQRHLAGRGCLQPQQAAAQGGFAAARFADQADGLALGNAERHTIDGAQHALGQFEMGLKIADSQQAHGSPRQGGRCVQTQAG
jgi:hypothetical protein